MSQIIENIRQMFLDEFTKNRDLYYEADAEKIKTNDWSIERFVLVNKTEDDALKALIKAMKWRKSFGVLDRNDQSFPKELYCVLTAIPYGNDKMGRPFLLAIYKYHHKSDFGDLLRQYTVHQIEKIDSRVTSQGWGFICDLIGAGVGNIDMEYAYFLIKVFQNYYPRAPKYVIAIEIPWILNTTWNIIKNFMPEMFSKAVVFVKKEQLMSYINADNIPVRLSGNSIKSLTQIPDGVKSLEEMEKFHTKQIEKFRSIFRDAIMDNS